MIHQTAPIRTGTPPANSPTMIPTPFTNQSLARGRPGKAVLRCHLLTVSGLTQAASSPDHSPPRAGG